MDNVASMNIANGILVVSVQAELYDETVERLQKQVLDLVHDKGLRGVLIDLSGVEIIDSFMLRMLMDTAKMVKLLGSNTLFTGIAPELVASLVDFGSISDDIRVVLNVEEGLQLLGNRQFT